MTTSGAVLIKAGANVSTIISQSGAEGFSADTLITQFINEAEAYVNTQTRYNWTDVYATGLDADVKHILDEVVSNIAAMYCIQYDMGGYTSRLEAQTMLDILWDRINKDIQFLRDVEKTDFIKSA